LHGGISKGRVFQRGCGRPPARATDAATFDYRSALTKSPTIPLRDIQTAAIMPLLQ